MLQKALIGFPCPHSTSTWQEEKWRQGILNGQDLPYSSNGQDSKWEVIMDQKETLKTQYKKKVMQQWSGELISLFL